MNVATIATSLHKLQSEVGTNCTLVAVSKTKPISDLLAAYEAGQRHFGENKVQELVEKAEKLPKDIHWHFIGHLQRNKVKFLLPFVHLIHSIDSIKLLEEVEKRASQISRSVNCLLQVHIAEEETKFGFDPEEILSILNNQALQTFPHVRIRGLMGMATNTDDKKKVMQEFEKLKQLFDQVKSNSDELHSLDTLSMGMTSDYQEALTAGSNMIRIGSLIFGERNY